MISLKDAWHCSPDTIFSIASPVRSYYIVAEYIMILHTAQLHTVIILLYYVEHVVEINVRWAQRNSLGHFWALVMWAAQGNWLTIDFSRSHRLLGVFTWMLYWSVDIHQKYWCGSHQSDTVRTVRVFISHLFPTTGLLLSLIILRSITKKTSRCILFIPLLSFT